MDKTQTETIFDLMYDILEIVGYEEPTLSERYLQFFIIVEKECLNRITEELSVESREKIEEMLDSCKMENKDAAIQMMSKIKDIITREIDPQTFMQHYSHAFNSVFNDYIGNISGTLTPAQRKNIDIIATTIKEVL